MRPRIATTTTLRAGGEVIRTFVRYHQALGFDHVFLFFDDPADPDYAEATGWPGVTCLRSGPELLAEQRATPVYAKYAPHVASEVMARQNLNVCVALARARALGIDWLLHLDIDELVHVPGGDARAFFAGQADRTDQVAFFNHEAVPETEEIGDYFREVSLFKRNPHLFDAGPDWRESFWFRRGWYFNGYDIGKAAVRVASEPVDDGPHRFVAPRGRPGLHSHFQADAVVLHYPTCGLTRFLAKYRTLGRFADSWYGTEPIPDGFHRRARDVVLDGSLADCIEFYRRHVLLRDVSIADELERDRMVRIELPAERFG